ncbi:MAG: alpha/beta fold hydrolase [Kofleriaceae bacterium]
MRALFFVVLAGCGAATPPPASSPRTERTLTGGGLSLFFRVIDGGAPAFVLEAGGGADSASWGTFPIDLAKATGRRVIAYDRAGFGKSPFPAKPFAIADELAALHADLHELGADRIVPVAASYGALIAVAYTKTYPDQIAGLVFVDPMNADFVEAVGLERVMTTVPKISALKSDLERAVARMVEGFPDLIASLHGVRWPANLPVVIVSAATPPFPAADLQAAWRASHVTLAATPGASRVLATKSDHDITETEPEVVVAAAQRVLARP